MTVCALLAALFSFGMLASAHAKGPAPAVQTEIRLAQLPKQGQETYANILRGAPFPYDKDGTVFGNREKRLPIEKRGYYREYTVKTPFSRDRGARRIVCGGLKPKQPDVCYYTDDHYDSFKRIVVQ